MNIEKVEQAIDYQMCLEVKSLIKAFGENYSMTEIANTMVNIRVESYKKRQELDLKNFTFSIGGRVSRAIMLATKPENDE